MTPTEYNECVDAHADGLYRFMLKGVRDSDTAKDLVQDAFERLWVRCGQVERPKARSWLFTVAYRAMIDHLRRSGRQDDSAPEIPVTAHQYSDLNETLHRAIEQLPADQRSVVLLRDYEGYSYEEIGQITRLSEAQVKVYIFRARQFLKSYLGSIDRVV